MITVDMGQSDEHALIPAKALAEMIDSLNDSFKKDTQLMISKRFFQTFGILYDDVIFRMINLVVRLELSCCLL